MERVEDDEDGAPPDQDSVPIAECEMCAAFGAAGEMCHTGVND